MLLDVTLGTNDLPRALRFYDAIFAVLGQKRLADAPEGWAGWGADFDSGVGFWLCPPFDGHLASAGNGTMMTFRADNAAQVRAFHVAGLRQGGTDEGAPGIRARYDPSFYVAYLRDPDGHKLACVYHRYNAAEDV